ncbi:MAG: hypothetical protein SOI13_04410 [Bifidobacterium mongoliense]|jgi:uncharacterized small protein (DUF1192 family)
MKQPEIDANRVIDNLTTRIAALERENAILTAQLQQQQEDTDATD